MVGFDSQNQTYLGKSKVPLTGQGRALEEGSSKGKNPWQRIVAVQYFTYVCFNGGNADLLIQDPSVLLRQKPQW